MTTHSSGQPTAGDPCAMCGSTDTGEDEGAAFCRSCGADDRPGEGA